MSLITPKVAIIGRPNVGKSTLFNIITDSRKSVVKNQPGVTRDILIEPVEIWGKAFDIIDTGGITEAQDLFSKLIHEQVSDFLQTVDFIIVVMDGRVGLIPEDHEVLKLAQHVGKPRIVVINKADKVAEEEIAKSDFYELGEDLIAASFEQRRGITEVLEWVTKQIPDQPKEEIESLRIAIVGKPNAGKSSLCNALVGQNRMLVSTVAGTTIDAVEVPFFYNEKQYILVDTAGLRKSARRDDDVEIISAFKSQEAIRHANIVLLVIDGLLGPSEQDAKIMQAVLEGHKGVILVVNKADEGQKIPEFKKIVHEQIQKTFHFFDDVLVTFISAKNGNGLEELMEQIEELDKKRHFRVSTSDLNDFFFETIRKAPAPVWGTTNVKFYYLTQTFQKPPAFIAFANHPDGVTNSYRRFLIKHLKEKFDLWGIPIRIFCMKSRRSGSSSEKGQ